MKNFKFLLLLFLCSYVGCNSDNSNNDIEEEYIGDVILKTQQEVNEFGLKKYLNIIGSLFVTPESSSDIDDLSALENLIYISGDLQIVETEIKNINGFNNLTKIGGGLYISRNFLLTNTNGLNKLATVGSNYGNRFQIYENPLLKNLDGFENLNTVNGQFWISDNNSLEHIKGLNNLTFIGSNCYIFNNPKLKNLEGLENIASLGTERIPVDVEGHLHIDNNSSLSSLKGLNNLSLIRGYLQVSSNNSLVDLDGLIGLTQVKYGVVIQNNIVLKNLNGFSNLNVAGGVTVEYNESLDNHCGFQSLFKKETIDKFFSIKENLFNPSKQEIIDGNCSL